MEIKETDVKVGVAAVKLQSPIDELFEREIKRARKAGEPISQLMLAKKLVEVRHISIKEAEAIAEDYVNREDLGIPQYLSSEFGLVWMKVLAFVGVIITMAIFYATIRLAKGNLQVGLGLFSGFIFLGLATYGWLKALAKGG